MNRLYIFLLLFANDLALFKKDTHSLQAQLELYSTRWGLTIIVANTKMYLFE